MAVSLIFFPWHSLDFIENVSHSGRYTSSSDQKHGDLMEIVLLVSMLVLVLLSSGLLPIIY